MLISNDSFAVLELLYSGSDLPDPLPDDCLRQLKENGLIVHQIIGHHRNPDPTAVGAFAILPDYETYITEKGKAYYESVQSDSEFSEKQLAILQGISDRLERRVDVAEEEAQRAKKDARIASLQSWIAIVISVLSLFMPKILAMMSR